MRSITLILAVVAGLAVASPAKKLARTPDFPENPDCGPKEVACCTKEKESDEFYCFHC